MSNNHREAEKLKIENEIPICGDGWLAVFDLIAPRQLGLEIALLSHRFDYYVDEHFRTRKRILGDIRIEWKKGENGTKQMQITNEKEQLLPIPQVPVPKKVIGFRLIWIRHFNQKIVDFLHHFRRLFALCGTYLRITSLDNNRFEFVMHNMWPLIKDNIRRMSLTANRNLSRMRQFVPSFLNDCPSLRLLSAFYDVFPSFPSDDSANATDGQLVAKWLFSSRLLLDGAPKVLQCELESVDQLSSKLSAFKTAFSNATSSANFFVIIFDWSMLHIHGSVFELTNELTGEQLTLKRVDNCCFLLIRCPISRDEQKWAKWEAEAIDCQFGDQNRIDINLNEL